jgi:hypothetical protein
MPPKAKGPKRLFRSRQWCPTHLLYKLVTDTGGDPEGNYYVTEQLTDLDKAPPWGQSTDPVPNQFDDVVGHPSIIPIDETSSGAQYFLVSRDPHSLNDAFRVPISVPGVGDFGVQGIWWRRKGAPETTDIRINGRRAPSICRNKSLF